MSPDPDSVLESIHRTLKWLVISTVVLFLCGAAIAGYVYVQSNMNRQALCALRGNLESQVKTSEAFLAENPHGIPGISPATLRASTQNQERAIDALGIISC